MALNDIIIIGYIINLILIIVVVFFQRREPTVSLAWAMAFIFLPVIGMVIFLIFGTGLKSRAKKRYLQKLEQEDAFSERILSNKRYVRKIFSTPYSSIARYLEKGANSPYTADNKVEIFTDAQSMYNRLIMDIQGAKDSINLMYFIWRNDEIGNTILKELTKKAKDGVEVRLLYDDIGCIITDKKIFDELKAAGGHVVPFFPVISGLYSKLNHRNHRKITVIDGDIGYLGGMNIGDEYMGKKKPSPWRDTHIRVRGSAVVYIQKYFALDWEFSTDERLDLQAERFFMPHTAGIGNVGMQIAASGPERKDDEIEFAMLKMISAAKKYIYIQTPYFVPDKAFLTELLIAARSGVDVRVMLPGIPDKAYVYYVTMSYVADLLDAGVKVYLYNGFIHSKTMVIDDTVATIGTTNIDIRSFQLHFEMNAFMYDEKTAVECREIFEHDEEQCRQITRKEYNRRGIGNVIKEGFFRLFSPIM